MSEITAMLRDAAIMELPNGKYKLVGTVYGDTKGRFSDGDRIVTSTVISVGGDEFRTVNSVYRVESWEAA